MKENVKITSIDHYGRGISKVYEKIIFVKNALLDEIVEIKIINNKKNYCEAIVNNYVKKSSKRVEAKCKYYGICGGCNIMHMSYKEQLLFKENKVKEALFKFAKIDKNVNEIVASEEFNYRNKITLQVKEKLGLYKDSSYEIVNIDKCLISDDKINNIIEKLNKMNLNNINQIVIKTSINETMVVLCLFGRIDENYFINELSSLCTSIIRKYKNEFKSLFGGSYIREKMDKYDFNISADSFFQVNTKQAIKMYDLIKKNVSKNDNVLDLYCGTGTIGIYISDSIKKVTGIEINKYAIKDAKNNANLNNVKNIEFLCGDVKDLIGNIKNIDTIIVDPPRSGLDNETIKHIIRIKPKKIIYVSCDPITLARDLSILKEDYNINSVTPLDMFPNTYHVECCSLLSLKEDKKNQ